MPGIVHADEDAEQIRFEMDDVALDAGVEVHDAIAADTSVENTEPVRWPCAQELGGGYHDVSVTKAAKIVRRGSGLAIAPAIGDGVALKEDGLVVFNHFENWWTF